MISNTDLQTLANQLRRDVMEMTTASKNGHPSTCMSCAEIMSVLFFSQMSYDTHDNPDNDEFVLSKGHAAPILYAALKRGGKIKDDLLNLRKFGNPLQGHPIPKYFPWAKVASGSLGQGLSNGIGMALASTLQKRNYMTYVLLGDSELAEGSVWEAVMFASHYKLSNLVAIADINRLGQTRATMLEHDMTTYKKRFESFGWNVHVIDGHDITQIKSALSKTHYAKPTILLAKTFKGKGVSFIENKDGWHGRALKADELQKALDEIPEQPLPLVSIKKPHKQRNALDFTKPSKALPPLRYKKGELIATRSSYGDAIKRLAEADSSVVVVDAEVGNSTFANAMEVFDESRFIESFIAEQNMIGISAGLSAKGQNVLCGSFAAFLTRSYDQIRMAALSTLDLTIVGSHAGVSIGEDGASQMGLEDLGMFKNVLGSTVLYPSDAVSAEKLIELATNTKGISYVRTSRPKTPVIYSNSQSFSLGNFAVVKQSNDDILTLVGAGVTLHECLYAATLLEKMGVSVAVVDCYCLKPFNEKKFAEFSRAHGGLVHVVEDNFREGGIGETILHAVCNTSVLFSHQYVNSLPSSGTEKELLGAYRLDAASIVQDVLRLQKNTEAKK